MIYVSSLFHSMEKQEKSSFGVNLSLDENHVQLHKKQDLPNKQVQLSFKGEPQPTMILNIFIGRVFF